MNRADPGWQGQALIFVTCRGLSSLCANMKKMFYISVLLISLGSMRAQNRAVDSLEALLSHTQHDTIKVKLLDQLADLAPDDTWETYNNQLKTLAEQKLKSCPLALTSFYTRYLAIAIGNEGLACNNRGDVKKAIGLYENSLVLAGQVHDHENMARTYTNLGRALYRQGNILKALQSYEASLKLYVQLKDKSMEAFTLNLIAELYRDHDDPGKALTYYKKALRINENLQDTQGIACSLNGIGTVCALQGQTEEALGYFRRSLQVAEQHDNADGIAAALNSIGFAYRNAKDATKAILYFKKSLRILEEINARNSIIYSFQNIGAAYSLLNQDDSAAFYFQKGLGMAREIGNPEIIYQSANGLYLVYRKKGQLEKALGMYELSNKMRDSIYNDNIRKAAIRSQFRYEYEKKAVADSLKAAQEKALTLATLRQERTQRYALVLGIALLLLLGFILFQRVRHRQKLEASRLRNKIASDLHDEVGSSLSSISMYAGAARMSADQATSQGMVEKIERTSRETIGNMSDIVWSIQPKNDDFLNVMKKMESFGQGIAGAAGMQFGFSYGNGVGKIVLDIEQRKNLYLIYKEAVNNAVKHSGAARITVRIEKNGKMIWMSIRDDGAGISQAKHSNGNGLQNMAQRAGDLGGQLDVASQTGGGTIITLQFKTT